MIPQNGVRQILDDGKVKMAQSRMLFFRDIAKKNHGKDGFHLLILQ